MSTPEHAGFLLAMGLQGHLRHGLKKPDVLLYLDAGHNLTTMAILLGEAATHRGTMDLATRKMLCLHIPSLLPQNISEYDHAPAVQNAAVVGIGLLYMGTVHRLMAEFLIGEIGRRPANDRGCVDRESYALSAGMALGMVTLGQGGNVTGVDGHSRYKGLSDLRLEDRLHQYMVGGSHLSTTGSSEEHWRRSDNRYALDQNGVHCYRGGMSRGRKTGSVLDSVFQVDMGDPITNGGGTTGASKKESDGYDGKLRKYSMVYIHTDIWT